LYQKESILHEFWALFTIKLDILTKYNMSNILRLVLCLIAYVFLFGSAVYMLAEPAAASSYIGNFERIPAVQDRPPQAGRWKLTPTVIVCEYAPISEVQALSAVNFWKRLGYRFYNTQYKYDPLNKCLSESPKGYIVIHMVAQGVKMEESAIAQTQFYVDTDTHEIEWAIIYLRTDVLETVLEHELGHALGFLHFNNINHLMNEKWTMGGWDTNGLENRRQ